MLDSYDTLTSAMVNAISKALENMAFEEAELIENGSNIERLKKTCAKTVWASLPVIYPLSGKFVLIIPRECAKIITSDIYGAFTDDHISDEAILDAIGEILNTITGRFLAALIPPDQVFDLGLPCTGTGMPVTEADIISSVSLNMNGHLLTGWVIGEDFRQYLNKENRNEVVYP